jgi:hypothetical protein
MNKNPLMKVVLGSVLLLVLLVPGSHARAQGGYLWQRTVVDSEGNVGEYTSLALTGSGAPCISYFDAGNKALKYAHRVGSTWQTETVEKSGEGGDTGRFTSLALDGADHSHISYHDLKWGDLEYAHYDGSQWHIETVEGYGGNFGLSNSLALDAADHPHIAYSEVGSNWGHLKYAYYDGATWHKEVVDGPPGGDVGQCISLALGGDDHPHISYCDRGNWDLKYAYHDGSQWHIETVDAEGYVGYDTALAVDSSGRPHIAYLAETNQLRYARYDGTQWHIEMVDDDWAPYGGGEYISLALDSHDRPYISYDRAVVYQHSLRLVYFDGAAWQSEVVDTQTLSTIAFPYTSLALDGNDQPHISYYDAANGDLKYAFGLSPDSLTNKVYLPLVMR